MNLLPYSINIDCKGKKKEKKDSYFTFFSYICIIININRRKIAKKKQKNIVKASGFFDIFKSETFQFIIGLTFLLCSVSMILAFTSFFFTGGSDMSILEHPIGDDLGMHNNIRNCMQEQGAKE